MGTHPSRLPALSSSRLCPPVRLVLAATCTCGTGAGRIGRFGLSSRVSRPVDDPFGINESGALPKCVAYISQSQANALPTLIKSGSPLQLNQFAVGATVGNGRVAVGGGTAGVGTAVGGGLVAVGGNLVAVAGGLVGPGCFLVGVLVTAGFSVPKGWGVRVKLGPRVGVTVLVGTLVEISVHWAGRAAVLSGSGVSVACSPAIIVCTTWYPRVISIAF